MTDSYLQLRKIAFTGPKKRAELAFASGVNVICGASDTGKSFLAESIDFMLGGSKLKEIPERVGYGEAALEFATSEGEDWRLQRATSGGDFRLTDLNADGAESTVLKQNHAHDRADNVSGFLLEKIGLLGKRILKSSTKGTTQSLSFRNLARLVIVHEGEIQQSGSPFWGGQFTLKTVELATVKLLVTGVDDSNVVAAGAPSEPDNSRQIALIDELVADLTSDIADIGNDQSELSGQLDRLEASIETQRHGLTAAQEQLNQRLASRRDLLEERSAIENRLDEIDELLARFELLREHYEVDTQRLAAIQESGSMFVHVQQAPCPLCGASPDAQHLDGDCDGDVEAIVQAASAEIAKIRTLSSELLNTVSELREERGALSAQLAEKVQVYDALDAEIRETVSPQVGDARATFSSLVEERRQRSKGDQPLRPAEQVGGA